MLPYYTMRAERQESVVGAQHYYSTDVARKKRSVLGSGVEPETYSVLRSRHNQLDHPSMLLSHV